MAFGLLMIIVIIFMASKFGDIAMGDLSVITSSLGGSGSVMDISGNLNVVTAFLE